MCLQAGVVGELKMKQITYTFFTGIIAGVSLGLLLKLLQQVTGYKVYRLLLNIDYIPGLGSLHLPEFLEFALHLIVAVLLAFILMEIAIRLRMTGRAIILLCIGLNIGIAICYYPLTNVSEKTPPLNSFPAFLL
jgi:ABC-type branched-subunit amino acid transport system permease subunit